MYLYWTDTRFWHLWLLLAMRGTLLNACRLLLIKNWGVAQKYNNVFGAYFLISYGYSFTNFKHIKLKCGNIILLSFRYIFLGTEFKVLKRQSQLPNFSIDFTQGVDNPRLIQGDHWKLFRCTVGTLISTTLRSGRSTQGGEPIFSR